MKREVYALIALALLPLAGAAQSVKLPDKVTVKPNRLATVAVQWSGDDFAYVVPPELDVFREYHPDPQTVRLRLLGATPGTYTIHAVATACGAGGKAKLSPVSTCVVVVEGTLPPVPPTPPGPDPKPPVPPVTGPLWLIVVYESAAVDAAASRVMMDTAAWNELAAGKWRFFDKDSPSVVKNGYARYQVEAGGLPMLLVLDQTGKKLRAVRLPDTTDKLRQLVKEVRGGS